MVKKKERKIEYVPNKMIYFVEEELKKMKNEGNREPYRVDAWERIADRLTRELFNNKGTFKLK